MVGPIDAPRPALYATEHTAFVGGLWGTAIDRRAKAQVRLPQAALRQTEGTMGDDGQSASPDGRRRITWTDESWTSWQAGQPVARGDADLWFGAVADDGRIALVLDGDTHDQTHHVEILGAQGEPLARIERGLLSVPENHDITPAGDLFSLVEWGPTLRSVNGTEVTTHDHGWYEQYIYRGAVTSPNGRWTAINERTLEDVLIFEQGRRVDHLPRTVGLQCVSDVRDVVATSSGTFASISAVDAGECQSTTVVQL